MEIPRNSLNVIAFKEFGESRRAGRVWNSMTNGVIKHKVEYSPMLQYLVKI